MSKMTPEQKVVRKRLKQGFEEAGGDMFSFADERVTIGVSPAVPGEAKFAHVAIAQCADGDEFKRKQGELLALSRWDAGDVLRVPYAGRDHFQIAHAVLEVLSPLYDEWYDEEDEDEQESASY